MVAISPVYYWHFMYLVNITFYSLLASILKATTLWVILLLQWNTLQLCLWLHMYQISGYLMTMWLMWKTWHTTLGKHIFRFSSVLKISLSYIFLDFRIQVFHTVNRGELSIEIVLSKNLQISSVENMKPRKYFCYLLLQMNNVIRK